MFVNLILFYSIIDQCNLAKSTNDYQNCLSYASAFLSEKKIMNSYVAATFQILSTYVHARKKKFGCFIIPLARRQKYDNWAKFNE
jgi:hypothetical protein